MKPLAEQMYVYASYHRDRRNKAFHFLGVPLITFAILVPMALARLPVGGFHVSLAMLFVLAVLVYYLLLDVPLAVAMLVFIAPVLALAEWVALQGAVVWGTVFGVAFVVGWIIQLAGHAFEGRRPALTDNLFQVIVAPIFLMTEVFFALGAKKELHAEVERLLDERGLYGVTEQTSVSPA
jgi:uncharacterized membrane protein YGL010W